MPTFHIEMFEGCSVGQKCRLVEEVMHVTCESLGCAPDAVDVIIADIKRESWVTGGVLWSEQK